EENCQHFTSAFAGNSPNLSKTAGYDLSLNLQIAPPAIFFFPVATLLFCIVAGAENRLDQCYPGFCCSSFFGLSSQQRI
ncbi:MAG TPA: hypothetical protein PK951_02220, partial [Chitinophagaceae bacterium]|nr:hypothetical protein [Chitinophagaceae bacterium]